MPCTKLQSMINCDITYYYTVLFAYTTLTYVTIYYYILQVNTYLSCITRHICLVKNTKQKHVIALGGVYYFSDIRIRYASCKKYITLPVSYDVILLLDVIGCIHALVLTRNQHYLYSGKVSSPLPLHDT